MRFLKPIRSIFLAAALTGCGGDLASAPDTGGAPRSQAQGLACEDLVPSMTGANTPSGAVTRSGVYSASYEAWQAFDASFGSMWISQENQTPAWIGYQWASGTKTVQRYAIHYVNGSITTRAPKQWTFEGWNGTAWVVLDTRTNQVNWTGNERREFAVASPGAYSRYRLNISDDNDTRTGIVVISMGRLELLNCASSTYPATQAAWTRTTGSPGGFTRVHDMTGDPSGRTYITGMTQPGLDGSPLVGLMDAFLQARDSAGNKLWSVQIGAPDGIALGYGVARSRTWEDIYVGGFANGSVDGTPTTGYREALLAKYRYTGVRQWTRQLGNVGSSTEGYGVAVDGLDNVFLAGTVEGALDGQAAIGTSDAFVTKYDAAGNRLWTRKVGVAGRRTNGRRAAADTAGNVYVSGWTAGGLDGNALMGAQDLFVTKFDAAGVKQWTRQLGRAGTEVWQYGTSVDASGNVYLSGYSGGGLDGNPVPAVPGAAFLVKYDASGVKQFTRELSSAGGVFSMNLFVDDSGVYVAGEAAGDVGNPAGPNTTALHNFVAKYDTAGVLQKLVQQDAARLNAAEASTYSYGVTVDWDGNIYLGGFTYGSFSGNRLMGSPDGFVTKLPKP